LGLGVSVNKRLSLQLNLILKLLSCGFLVGATRSPQQGSLRTSIDNGLGLDLRQGRDLGGVHRHEPPSAIFRSCDNGLRLRCGLHHCLSLRLDDDGVTRKSW
jgi:hypothetical protein